MVIKDLISRKLKTHGTSVIRIGFSKKIKCMCTSGNEGRSSCTICLGTGYRCAIKKDIVILDTFMERNNITEKGIGNYQNVSIKIYSDTKIDEGEYIYEIDNNELFKVGSTYIERFENGEPEAYIAGATRTNELIYIINNIDFNLVLDRWCLYQKVIINRNSHKR